MCVRATYGNNLARTNRIRRFRPDREKKNALATLVRPLACAAVKIGDFLNIDRRLCSSEQAASFGSRLNSEFRVVRLFFCVKTTEIKRLDNATGLRWDRKKIE